MDIETLIRESKADEMSSELGIKTESGKAQFLKQVRLFSAHVPSLQRRQNTILAMREVLTNDPSLKKTFDSAFQSIAATETKLQTFFTESPVEKDSFEQLTFSAWKWANAVNAIPFALLALSFFKIYIVPAFALMTPIFMLLMPYIILRYWYSLQITGAQYFDLLFRMAGLHGGELFTPKNILQSAITLFSIGQGIYQPIQNAIHLKTVNVDLIGKGEAVEKFAQELEHICSLMPEQLRPKSPLDDVVGQKDPHRHFATTWDNVFRLHIALQIVGDLEVVYRLAAYDTLKKVRFQTRDEPCLLIRGGVDPFLKAETRVPFDIRFVSTKSHHAILTGPNRGGKSSVLRSTLLSVLFAQTFGLGFLDDESMFHLRPFDWISTGLRLEDRPGKISMFESEVEFATQILNIASSNKDKVGLVLFDELFHSTNPPDGAHTASIFLRRLWNQKNVASFISTHVFDLALSSPPHVQRLCGPAVKDENGKLTFTYTLKSGVCEVSSVELILKEKGLI